MTDSPRSHSARLLLALAALILAVLGAACAEEPTADPPEPVSGGAEPAMTALPEWIDRVYPAPQQEATGARDVQVQHNVDAPDERIYLTIDGIDVTAYAQEGRGELVYDPDRDRSGQPVELDPGEHSATLERARVNPETEQIVEIIDEFSWEFTVL